MKVLVVDDAKDIRLVIQRLVQRLGHEVDIASDGEEAWEKLQNNSYQVVISDWVMPRLDGLSLCRRIRAHSFSNYIYIILLTGKNGEGHLVEGIQAGADDFSNKPVNYEELKVRLLSARRVIDLEESLEEKHHELEDVHKHLTEELATAAQTQHYLLPDPIKEKLLQTSWFFKPAVYVGGDAFNYYSPMDKAYVFFSIDISGHGMSSAIMSISLQTFMALKRGLYGGRISRERFAEIPSIFAKNLNAEVNMHKSEHYLTMVFGIIDLQEHKLHYVQAGHPYPIWMDGDTKRYKALETSGFPIGLLEDVDYQTQELSFKAKDRFIVYSDGINENHSAINHKLFDVDNLIEHLENDHDDDLTQLPDNIKNKWLDKQQLEQLPDDISILAFEFNT